MGGKTLRQDCLKCVPEAEEISPCAAFERRTEQLIALRCEINLDRLAGTPIRGGLEHGRPAEASVREK